MSKKKRQVQYRFYEMPPDSYILALLGGGWVRAYGQDVDSSHFHNFLEIGYCHDGTGELLFGDHSRPYHEGCITILPANYIHNTIATLGTMSRWEYLFIDVQDFLGDCYPTDPDRAAEFAAWIQADALLLQRSEQPHIANLILRIMEEYREKQLLYKEAANGQLFSLLAQIARLHPRPRTQSDRRQPLQLPLLDALDYVRRHYAEPLRMADIAEVCHISETHLRRQFGQYMHMSPLTYVHLVRIEAARKQLYTTSRPVRDIALACGFSSAASFNRLFKAMTGLTPMQWRKDAGGSARNPDKLSIMMLDGWL